MAHKVFPASVPGDQGDPPQSDNILSDNNNPSSSRVEVATTNDHTSSNANIDSRQDGQGDIVVVATCVGKDGTGAGRPGDLGKSNEGNVIGKNGVIRADRPLARKGSVVCDIEFGEPPLVQARAVAKNGSKIVSSKYQTVTLDIGLKIAVPSFWEQIQRQIKDTSYCLVVQVSMFLPMMLIALLLKDRLELAVVGHSSLQMFSEIGHSLSCEQWIGTFKGFENLVNAIFAQVFVTSINYVQLTFVTQFAFRRYLTNLAIGIALWAITIGAVEIFFDGYYGTSVTFTTFLVLWLIDVVRQTVRRRKRSLGKFLRMCIKVSGVALITFIFAFAVASYIFVTKNLGSLYMEVLVTGVLFPIIQNLLRRAFVRLSVTPMLTLLGENVEQVMGIVFSLVEVFLATPGFVGLLQIRGMNGFLFACLLSFATEIVGVWALVKWYTETIFGGKMMAFEGTIGNSNPIPLPSSKKAKRSTSYRIMAKEKPELSPDERMQFRNSYRRFAIRVAAEEWGEKNALVSASILMMGFAYVSERETTKFFQTLQRVPLCIMLEGLTDAIKHIICHRFKVYTTRVGFRLTSDMILSICFANLATGACVLVTWMLECYLFNHA